MKTNMSIYRLLLVLVLAITTGGAIAQQNQNPTQTVCVGQQVYNVDPVAGATFTWSISGGGAFVTPNGTNTITVDWTTPGGPYTLSVFATVNSCDGPPQTVDVTVVAQPVGPTLLATSLPYPDVCDGTDVWATFTPGSGGVNCTDEYQYSYDNVTWFAYTQGTNISTTGQTNVYIQGRRANCDPNLGCNGTNWVTLATWNVTVLPVSVTIVADVNPICAGQPITFTATPVNGGLTPQYTWFVNTVQQQQGPLNTFTYTPVNGDVVTCELLSSETCGAPNPATSNTVTVTVNPLPTTSPIWHN